MRMVEPSGASWLRVASALLASLEPWASGATGSRGSQLISGTLADLHAIDVVVDFAVLELANADASAGASAMAVAIDADADAGA